RVVREITHISVDMRWQTPALEALQERAEDYITGLMEDANYAGMHGRTTSQPGDMRLVRQVRREPGNSVYYRRRSWDLEGQLVHRL
ncbi:uncharacterized protein EV422DRAFT_498230, partial [Fimicolochytrium jonesii]|uniref:uncharacterized protein n=1 Tax=Fimicolochytrium jonesii TaxID=1396493 RepID=UPI0022FEC954